MSAEHRMSQAQFRDRTAWLIAGGLFQILLGCGSAMMIFVMLMGVRMDPQGDVRMMLPAIGFYAIIAALFVWLGIGSMMAQRWARALTLTIAWMWLAFGAMCSIIMVMAFSAFMEGDAPPLNRPETRIVFVAIMTATMGCFYVLLPCILILFYRSPDVRATCEFKNPQPSWTDCCPPPVLALVLMMALGAVSMPLSVSYNSVMPFFGMLLTGAPAAAVTIAISILFGYLAWANYKLKPSAWWITLIAYVAFMASSIVTFSRIEFIDYYRAMGMPQEQIDRIQKMNLFNSFNMSVYMSVILLVIIGYMLWIRRYYFVAKPPQADRSAS